MSDSIYHQSLSSKTICNDCAFCTLVRGITECIHPDEFEANCSTIIFCNSFQAIEETESPCVSFGNNEK